MSNKFIIFIILIISFLLRVYGLNWDNGYHLHPDERMITMVTERISIPRGTTISTILSPDSPLNPKFFAYGSFPIYLLKFCGSLLSFFDLRFATYDYLNLIGRFISAIFDTGTVFLIYLLGGKIFSKKAGILASIFYGFSVFPVQASHFYAVDAMLTFFITLTLYFLIDFIYSKNIRFLISAGISFGFALSTKISSILLVVPVILTIIIFSINNCSNLLSKIKSIIKLSFIVFIFTLITFVIFEPYAFIDFKTFWQQTQEQSRMTKDAFTFPYTLQYVNTIPYFYHLKNMVLWGMGIPLGLISIAGVMFITFITIKNIFKKCFENVLYLIVLLSFFWIYFLIVGSFAIKFMRYFLPLYPLFIVFGVVLLLQKKNKLQNYISIAVIVLIFAWNIVYSFSFLSIYSKPTTRINASEWISKNIPKNSTIAREHWDDGLPLFGYENYKFEELKLYDPDTDQKWDEINKILEKTDYIVIASNRLYTPLGKLTDCKILPTGRCYEKTAEYYKKLFSNNLGFYKTAEFFSYPTIPFINFPIIDDSADESFTVYDHPKIIIFKKNE